MYFSDSLTMFDWLTLLFYIALYFVAASRLWGEHTMLLLISSVQAATFVCCFHHGVMGCKKFLHSL